MYFYNLFFIRRSQINIFMIRSALVDIKYIATPLFENYLKNFNIKDVTMPFKHSFIDQPIIAYFITLFEKTVPFFSFVFK